VYRIFVNALVKTLFFPHLANTKRDHSTQTSCLHLWCDVQSDHFPADLCTTIHYLSISRSTTMVAQSLKWISMRWMTGVISSKGRDCTLPCLMLPLFFMGCWSF